MAKRADQRKFHYIYKITRTDGSGKYYVGMHSTDDLDDGYFGSGTLLAKSIKKHGKESHSKEILEFLPSREELKLREKELVNEELLGDKKCMNLQLGGGGGLTSEAHRQKFVNAGRQVHHIKMRIHKDYANEHSLKLSNAMRKRHKNGTAKSVVEYFSWEGKKHSQRTIDKMRKTKNVGNLNSQYGTCWVIKNVPIKIKKELLDEYIENGYRRGRK